MGKSKKGLTFSQLGILVITMLAVIGGVAIYTNQVPSLTDFIINMLGKEFGEYCGNGRCGEDETWNPGDPEKTYCPEDCPRPCFNLGDCNDGNFVDMGSLDLEGKDGDGTGAEVCAHSELTSHLEDYFKFSIEDAGKVTVTYVPEIFKPDGMEELHCLTPFLDVHGPTSDGCASGPSRPPSSSSSCEAIEVEIDVANLGEYYVEVGVGTEIEAMGPMIETKGRVSVHLGDLEALCRDCVEKGKKWCIKGDTERCVGDCWWAGCDMCIDKDPDYCAPTDPSKCGFYGEENCDEDPWCHYCFKCVGKKVSSWPYDVKGRCVDKDKDCGYSCSVDECGAECDLYNPCANPEQTCNFDTCQCETKYCCYYYGWGCILEDQCFDIGGTPTTTPCGDISSCESLPMP